MNMIYKAIQALELAEERMDADGSERYMQACARMAADDIALANAAAAIAQAMALEEIANQLSIIAEGQPIRKESENVHMVR